MAFSVMFGKTDKARNSTKVAVVGAACNVLLKDDTSIIRPVWRVHLGQNGAPASLAELSEMNYCYCAEFKRYYFITNIISETAVIALVACEVDVLATFRDDILATDAFIMYAESKFNSLIPDSRLPMTAASLATVSQFPLDKCDQEGCFCLTAATPNNDGKTGPSASVVMSEGNLMSLANTLYGENWWESIKNDFYHPNEALIACKWTPLVAGSAAEGGYQEIKVGKYSLGGGITAKRFVEGNINLPVHLEHANQEPDFTGHAGDYRNIEPYSEYYLYLPGAGIIQLPMQKLFGDGLESGGNLTVVVDWTASPITGDITYSIRRTTGYNGGGLLGQPQTIFVKGNFGVDIPLAGKTGNFGSVVQSVLGGTTGAAMGIAGIMTGNAPLAVMGFGGATTSLVSEKMASIQTSTTTSGSLGGWSVRPNFNMMVELLTVAYEISDEPSNITKVIGRPLFAKQNLGSMKGLVKCTGAFVKTWATEEEHQMIAQYVNSSTNFIYGGLIIE